jgi:hypothetical protein
LIHEDHVVVGEKLGPGSEPPIPISDSPAAGSAMEEKDRFPGGVGRVQDGDGERRAVHLDPVAGDREFGRHGLARAVDIGGGGDRSVPGGLLGGAPGEAQSQEDGRDDAE